MMIIAKVWKSEKTGHWLARVNKPFRITERIPVKSFASHAEAIEHADRRARS